MFEDRDTIELKYSDGNAVDDPVKEAKSPADDDEVENSKSKLGLKKTVGLVEGISLIVGIMIGSGIFASPRSVARRTGSVGLSLVVWCGCGLIAIGGALSYLELGLMFQQSGNKRQAKSLRYILISLIFTHKSYIKVVQKI